MDKNEFLKMKVLDVSTDARDLEDTYACLCTFKLPDYCNFVKIERLDFHEVADGPCAAYVVYLLVEKEWKSVLLRIDVYSEDWEDCINELEYWYSKDLFKEMTHRLLDVSPWLDGISSLNHQVDV